jgi:hypothetical protein
MQEEIKYVNDSLYRVMCSQLCIHSMLLDHLAMHGTSDPEIARCLTRPPTLPSPLGGPSARGINHLFITLVEYVRSEETIYSVMLSIPNVP